MTDLQKEFQNAADRVTNLSYRPSDTQLLELYGLFKQATIGDNETTSPWAIQVKERAKWDAWNSNKGMLKEEAMQNYIDLVNSL